MQFKDRPFDTSVDGKKFDTFTIKLNSEERKQFDEFKMILQQEKDSTSMKQLAWIGSKVLLADSTKEIIQVILNNYRKNKRQGIVTFD